MKHFGTKRSGHEDAAVMVYGTIYFLEHGVGFSKAFTPFCIGFECGEELVAEDLGAAVHGTEAESRPRRQKRKSTHDSSAIQYCADCTLPCVDAASTVKCDGPGCSSTVSGTSVLQAV